MKILPEDGRTRTKHVGSICVNKYSLLSDHLCTLGSIDFSIYDSVCTVNDEWIKKEWNSYAASYSLGTRVLCRSWSCRAREADHSLPSSASVKNECSYASTPHVCLHVMDRDNVTVRHYLPFMSLYYFFFLVVLFYLRCRGRYITKSLKVCVLATVLLMTVAVNPSSFPTCIVHVQKLQVTDF